MLYLTPLALASGLLMLAACTSETQQGETSNNASQTSRIQAGEQPVQPDADPKAPKPVASNPVADQQNAADQNPMSNENKETTPLGQTIATGEFNELSKQEQYVILSKGTDRPGSDGYTNTMDPGTYLCRQCNAALYHAAAKFESHCGWPSFDDEIDGTVTRVPDADGRRVEIVCTNCKGHLGHVFEGERRTAKNTRHCVNSSSMSFVAEGKELPAMIKP